MDMKNVSKPSFTVIWKMGQGKQAKVRSGYRLCGKKRMKISLKKH